MDKENKNKQNDQPKEEQQNTDKTQAEYREIPKEELNPILEKHKKWVETDGKEGERADLRKANLSDANLKNAELSKANFEKAELSNVNFKHASLRETNFRKANCGESNFKNARLNDANLQKVNFDGANLEKANFFRADLKKADLSNAKLKKTFLNRANLQKAELYDADLQKAKFQRASLQNAILSNANLHKADFYNAGMQNTTLETVKGLATANLQYTNFEGSTGLLGNAFSQADVTGAKLPDEIKEFKSLEIVKETSQNARKIFFAMLLGCVYSWLTIATTTDVRLLTNTASSPLPIIGTEIPIAWFYLATPLVLICLYFYFHLYLDNLWEELASLPAFFPDGKRVDQRAYPWLLNTIVRRHFKRFGGRPLIAQMKEWITIFLAWWVVPITMIAFWLRYIPRHEWWGTCLHIILILVSVGFAIIFYRLCALTLQGKKEVAFRLNEFWADRRFHYGVGLVIVGVIFSLLSYGAISGVKPHTKMNKIHGIKELVPWIFIRFKYDVFANFREKSVSEKPDNYGQILKKERLEFVRGANLKGADLKNADMYKSFLVKADLRNAKLQNTDLGNAELQNSTLEGANLQNADLRGANLEYADFRNANLHSANLTNANFHNISLNGANLQNADLTYIKNLQPGRLYDSKSLYKAKLDPGLRELLKKNYPHLLEEPKEETVKEIETEKTE